MSETKLSPPFKLEMPFKEALKRYSRVGKKDLDKQFKKSKKNKIKFTAIIAFTFLLAGCGGASQDQRYSACKTLQFTEGKENSEYYVVTYLTDDPNNQWAIENCATINYKGDIKWMFDN